MSLTPYPFQIQGVRRMLAHDPLRFLLLDEPGLGKTPQAILTLAARNASRVLVVCSKSLVLKWVDEFAKWWPESEPEAFPMFDSTHARVAQIEQWHRGEVQILVTNYEMARKFASQLKGAEWVIVDEAHRIKNRKALITKAVEEIGGTHRLLLTATPTSGRPDEYWPLLNYLFPEKYTSYWKFANQYCVWTQTPYTRFKYHSAKNLPALQAELSPFSLRRIKREVAPDLPPVRHEIVPLELERGQNQLIVGLKKNKVIRPDDGPLVVTPEKIVEITRIRQLCISPAILGFPDVSPKFDYVESVMSEAKRPVVIFSSFKEALNALERRLTGHRVVRITGDESQEERREAMQVVNSGTPCACLLTSAGGEGIDLVGADHLILLNLPWDPITYTQVLGRLDRIGQDNPVLITTLEHRGTVEERVRRLLETKQYTSEAALVRAAIEAEDEFDAWPDSRTRLPLAHPNSRRKAAV